MKNSYKLDYYPLNIWSSASISFLVVACVGASWKLVQYIHTVMNSQFRLDLCFFHAFCDGLGANESDWLERQRDGSSVYNVLCYTVTLCVLMEPSYTSATVRTTEPKQNRNQTETETLLFGQRSVWDFLVDFWNGHSHDFTMSKLTHFPLVEHHRLEACGTAFSRQLQRWSQKE